ncbi:hypothetical protein ACROYT_G015952 [Oculina patagonica]
MNSDDNPSTNPLSSLSNLPDSPDSDVEELDPLVLGASEEVNTSSCNDDRNIVQTSKAAVNVESFHPEILGLQKKSPLNSPYIYDEHSNMANETVNGEQRAKPTQINDFTDSESVRDTTNENGTNDNMTDSESSMITTTVVSEGISLDSARGIVVMEQVALEQINELIASTSQMQDNSSSGSNAEVEDPCDRRHFRSESQNSDSSSTELELSRQSLQEQVSIDTESADMFNMSRFEELDTKEIAEALTNELKKYSIPQAVFARKVLNRSQGTLSDVLRKPKPWNELRGGREIFRKMKEWLDLPEVKRIPQLRTEAALELDAKARKEELHVHGPAAKKSSCKLLYECQTATSRDLELQDDLYTDYASDGT